MMIKQLTKIWILCSLILLSVLFYWHFSEGKTGYVEINRLFSEFDMSREMNAELEKKFAGRQASLDSLYYRINTESQQPEAGGAGIENRKQQYNELRYGFETAKKKEQDNLHISILQRINEYIKQYGKEKKYKIIWGANGDGSLMYSEEGSDITGEVLQFINNKYRGK